MAAKATAGRLRGAHGFMLVEVLVAAGVLLIGVLAALGSFAASQRTTLSAQRHQVALGVAQRELEQMRAIDYQDLKPNGTPVSIGDPRHPTAYGLITIKTSPAYYEWLLLPDGDPASAVDPGPTDFEVGGDGDPATANSGAVTGRIYRYVSWRQDGCSQALCSGQDTKRILVAVKLDAGQGFQPQPVWVSSIAIDATDTAPDDPGACGQPQCPGDASITGQRFYLYDTPCMATVEGVALYADHPARNTAQTGVSDCRNTNTLSDPAPDLMGPVPPVWDTRPDPSPLYDWSTDAPTTPPAGSYPGGIAMPRAGASTTGCPWSYSNTQRDDPSADRNRWKVHAWATNTFDSDFTLSDTVSVSLWTTAVDGVSGRGKICVTLVERVEPTPDRPPIDSPIDTAIASWTFEKDPWSPAWSTLPARVAQWSRRLLPDLPGPVIVEQGNRLMLVVAVRGESDNDLVLLYSRPDYPSHLTVTTSTPCEGSGTPC